MRRTVLLAVAASLALLSACSGTVHDGRASVSAFSQEPATSDATVFAAASLSAVFPQIAEARYFFDGSSGLVDQLKEGAPADVFASADKATMDAAVEAGLIDGHPVMFATNHLVLVTPADNPAGITGFDSSLTDALLVVCAAEVPCGAATAAVAEANGVALAPVSEESKVTDVLGKVISGEADAGLVYATDATGAGDKVTVFDVPGATGHPSTYWIAKVADAGDDADAFVAAVTGAAGQARLAAFGFGPPTVTRFPRWTLLPAGLTLTLLAVPLLGLVLRANWAELPALLLSERSVDALRLSLVTCLISTVLVLLLGVPTALVLARTHARLAAAARTLVTIPMVLPPVVAGLALLTTFGRRGLLGASLSAAGIEIGFTTVAVVIAQTFVALPFLVVSLEGALRSAGTDYEAAAGYLGASPSRVFWRVTLPMAAPALASGTALSFARALGEFGATLTFAGSLQGTTRTLPLEIYLLRESDSELAMALAVILLAVAALVVWLATRLHAWGAHA